MKKFFSYMCLVLATFFIVSCASNNTAQDSVRVQALLSSGDFTFNAKSAHPTNMDVINVMNSMPNMGAGRILNLDYGYIVKITPTKVDVHLPYFGRMFTANIGSTKNGYDFTSENFSIDKSRSTDKKTVWIITINDQQNAKQLFFEIYKTGRAYLSINSNDRQAISYDGSIDPSEKSEK